MIWRRPLPRFCLVELAEADLAPHVIVDGAARSLTRLTLSHWPGSPTPRPFWRDLSTESCFAYLARSTRRLAPELVTSDHLDEDALVSLKVLIDPEGAHARAAELLALARAGDFGVVSVDAIAKVGFALRAWFDQQRSPFSGAAGARPSGDQWRELCFRESLGRFDELIAHPDRFRDLYEEEYARYRASGRALEIGDVVMSDDPASSMTIVKLEPSLGASLESPLSQTTLPVHPWVIHSASRRARVLVASYGRYCYYDRYETWVRYMSRPFPGRRDLSELALRLSEAETAGTRWHADLPSALVAVLRHDGQSSLAPEFVTRTLDEYLRAMPVAFSAFGPEGPRGLVRSIRRPRARARL